MGYAHSSSVSAIYNFYTITSSQNHNATGACTCHMWGGVSWPSGLIYCRKQSLLKIVVVYLMAGKTTWMPPPVSLAVLLIKVSLTPGPISICVL